MEVVGVLVRPVMRKMQVETLLALYYTTILDVKYTLWMMSKLFLAQP